MNTASRKDIRQLAERAIDAALNLQKAINTSLAELPPEARELSAEAVLVLEAAHRLFDD
jgi:hypothetical protein